MPAPRIALVTALTITALLLTACGTSDESAPEITPTFTAVPVDPSGTASPSPSPTTKRIAIPDDCRALLSDDVLSELGETPLNDPAFGESGKQDDGSLICTWADPGADTTSLVTTISRINRGPALDMLNDLADNDGFTCFTPDKGTRCEKTWQNETYPVTDGRTLFWRDDVLIDTQYSNLAPSGYTTSIVETLFK